MAFFMRISGKELAQMPLAGVSAMVPSRGMAGHILIYMNGVQIDRVALQPGVDNKEQAGRLLASLTRALKKRAQGGSIGARNRFATAVNELDIAEAVAILRAS
jgi:hypothetical protein